MKIEVTEKEIIGNPNYYKLGELVYNKYWQQKNSLQEEANYLDDKFVSDDGFDLCVICGQKSPYYTHANVELRLGYVDGVGQGCFHPSKCDKL